MTDDAQKAERREIADTLVRALERRHELLDVIVESEDYDAAVEAIASMLGTTHAGGEAVLRLSFDRLTKVSRRRIRDELEDLNHELSFTEGSGSQLLARAWRSARSPRRRTGTSSPPAQRTSARPATDRALPRASWTTRSAPPSAGCMPKRRCGWWRSTDPRRSAWCSASWPVERSTSASGSARHSASTATALPHCESRARRWRRISPRCRWWCAPAAAGA